MEDGKTISKSQEHLVLLWTLNIECLVRSRSKLEAVYRLHQLGIRHGGLGREKNFVTHEDKVYIIDFSKAKARCGCELTRDRIRLCTELVQMERQLGDGKTNRVLEEIGVPPWILMAYEVKPDETAAPRCAL